ncbi:uncharacterized protein KY384_006961 [Bacidia gigantensis]|uniref:uncharacterized protein n=1 Tax=Bacidia gigantensis TaxID=2732470 RepID=UPI001D05790E|nr:uncharacterized protein KY384_006961 [Bacidia gigantensis]KAG8528045.1 hypothetical protein KY384_006961 [Bacidia gigantensis]
MGSKKRRRNLPEATVSTPNHSTNEPLAVGESSKASTSAQRRVNSHDPRQRSLKPGDSKKRDRQSERTSAVTDSPPTKKMRTECDARQVEGTSADETGLFNAKPYDKTAPPLSAEVARLSETYNFVSIFIISSSKIEKKVRQIIERLDLADPSRKDEKSEVVIVHADAAIASKAISVVEIAKRELQKGGAWWQYTKLEGTMKDVKTKVMGKMGGDVERIRHGTERSETDSNYIQNPMGGELLQIQRSEEEIEECFETMSSPKPLVVPIENRKVKNIPTLRIYLARCRIPALKGLFG